MKKAVAIVMVASGLLVLTGNTANATGDDDHKVTICHRTNSVTNPYTMPTVDDSSVDKDTGNDNGQGDHNAEHNGPAFDFTGDPDVLYPPPHNGDQWGDIIPPFYEDGSPGYWPAKNWDATGQAIFYAECSIPVDEPTTTTVPETTTTTVPETTTTTVEEPTTTTTVEEPTTVPTVPTTKEPPTSEPTLVPATTLEREDLPRTGAGTLVMFLVGVLLLIVGTLGLAYEAKNRA